MLLRRFTAIMLSVLLLFALLPPSTSAEGETVPSELIWERVTGVTSSVSLTEAVFDNGSRQSEHYIEYRPGGPVLPRLVTGDSIRRKLSYGEAVEGDGGRTLACVNGDYYVMRTGMPLGLAVRDGELLSSDDGNCAFGFLEDGSAFLGRPALTIRLDVGGGQLTLGGINKDHRAGTACLFTPAWGSSADSGEDTRCLLLEPEENGALRIGGELRYTVDSVLPEGGIVEIPADRHLLVLPEAEYRRLSDVLAPGGEATLTVTAGDARFGECITALGCLYRLLEDGEAPEDLDRLDRNHAPRTAIGIREDGTVVFYTADGRQAGYAQGLTLSETAQRLAELGCASAGVLDGGASTVLGAQLPGGEACAVRNLPSLGEPRETPQYLLLESPAEEAGLLDCVGVYCDEKVLLCGSSCVFTCGGCDSCGNPVEPGSVSWSADSGSIRSDGRFTAPVTPGVVTVTAEAGGVSGVLRIPVIGEPEELRLIPETDARETGSLRLRPGDSVGLTVRAFWNALPVCSSGASIVWEAEGGIGSIRDGEFTAAAQPAAGSIRAAVGAASAELSVLVIDRVLCLDGFENVTSGGADGLRWSGETLRDRVKYGRGSLRLDYDLSEGDAVFSMEAYETGLLEQVSLWVLSDGSGVSLYSDHEAVSLLLGRLDRPGWMLCTVDVGFCGPILDLRLSGEGKGSIWLDQLLLYGEGEPDIEAPVVRLSQDGGELTGSLWDREDGLLRADELGFTVDGRACAFEYSEESGEFRAVLPDGPGPFHAVLTARDGSGNYNSASLLTEGGEASPFPDMEDHWARRYVNYLSAMGIVNGKPDGEGRLMYDPNSVVTRAEFSVMLCRWLRLDTDGASSGVVFADESDIPEWAADSVRAVAAAGLIQGAAAEGGLYFMPKQALTRAQAAVILGRTMEGGRMMADLPFPDAGDIPAWARSYAAELAFMGVMRGDGTGFDPGGSLTRAQAAKLLAELT